MAPHHRGAQRPDPHGDFANRTPGLSHVHFLPLPGRHERILRTGGEFSMRFFLVTYLVLGVVFAFGFLYVTLTRKGL